MFKVSIECVSTCVTDYLEALSVRAGVHKELLLRVRALVHVHVTTGLLNFLGAVDIIIDSMTRAYASMIL